MILRLLKIGDQVDGKGGEKAMYKRLLKICGRKFGYMGKSKFEFFRYAEEFMIPLKEPVRHQYFRSVQRLNRLLPIGHRCRGDVGL